MGSSSSRRSGSGSSSGSRRSSGSGSSSGSSRSSSGVSSESQRSSSGVGSAGSSGVSSESRRSSSGSSRSSSGTSSGSRSRHRGHSSRRRGGRRSKYGWMALLIGLGTVLLLWQIPRILSGRDVVEWDGLPYGPDQTGVRGVRYSSFVNGTEYMFVITPDDLAEGPDYDPADPAALEVSEAVTLAQEALGQYMAAGEEEAWYPESVALHHFTGSKWYYTVSFRSDGGAVSEDEAANQLRLPVLMNRQVLGGIVRKNPANRAQDLQIAAQALGVSVEDLALQRREGAAERQGSHDVTLIAHVDPGMFKFEIPRALLAEQADYDLAQPLPVTFQEAAATALKASRLYLPLGQAMKWQIKDVSLNRWGSSRKWYFLVEFRMKEGANAAFTPQLLIPVLLDGEAVAGQRLQSRLKAGS